jgi:hypothetical protein
MDNSGTMIGIGAGGGIIGVIIFSFFKFCYKRKLHSNCKSGCCETDVDIQDTSTESK